MKQRTEPIIINVFKDCATCAYLKFMENTLDDIEIGKCNLSNKVVTNSESINQITYIDIDCDKWKFDKRLLEEIEYFIDLNNSSSSVEE